MEGCSKKTFVHIMSCDENEPPDRQTHWHVKPLSMWDTGKWKARFDSVERVTKRGNTKTDIQGFNNAQYQSFRDIVARVENFKFSDDYPDLRAKGFMNIDGDDDDLMWKLFSDLNGSYFAELIEAADRESSPSIEVKKNSKSQPGNSSGNTTKSSTMRKSPLGTTAGSA